jgi:hypothetical protein
MYLSKVISKNFDKVKMYDLLPCKCIPINILEERMCLHLRGKSRTCLFLSSLLLAKKIMPMAFKNLPPWLLLHLVVALDFQSEI